MEQCRPGAQRHKGERQGHEEKLFDSFTLCPCRCCSSCLCVLEACSSSFSACFQRPDVAWRALGTSQARGTKAQRGKARTRRKAFGGFPLCPCRCCSSCLCAPEAFAFPFLFVLKVPTLFGERLRQHRPKAQRHKWEKQGREEKLSAAFLCALAVAVLRAFVPGGFCLSSSVFARVKIERGQRLNSAHADLPRSQRHHAA